LRLETLGFENVYDYVAGKAEWLANGLPREGRTADVLYAGQAVDADPPTCSLDTPLDEIRATLENARFGFCLVLGAGRVVLGSVRRSALDRADPSATADSLMAPGPSTARFDTPAETLVKRLARRRLATAVISRPNGSLVGVFSRADVEQQLH
jgi:CBS domain-containing protein